MRMAKSFIAAVLLAVALVGAVVVPAALTSGTFGFDAWPEAPTAKARDQVLASRRAPRDHAIARTERRPKAHSNKSFDAPVPVTTAPAAPQAIARAEPR